MELEDDRTMWCVFSFLPNGEEDDDCWCTPQRQCMRTRVQDGGGLYCSGCPIGGLKPAKAHPTVYISTRYLTRYAPAAGTRWPSRDPGVNSQSVVCHSDHFRYFFSSGLAGSFSLNR